MTQQLLQRIHASHSSTAPAHAGTFGLMLTLSIALFVINLTNFLVQSSGIRYLFLLTALLFVAAIVAHIVDRARLTTGFKFDPEGLRYRSRIAIPWAFLVGASVHPNQSSFHSRDVLLVLTPEGMQWVQQHRKGFLRLSKTGHGIDVAKIRGCSPQESAYVLNETIRLYRHRHGLPN